MSNKLRSICLFALSAIYLLPTTVRADCPDKEIPCTAVDKSGRTALLGYVLVNYKSEKKFFTALIDGFKCKPCLEGCGATLDQAIKKCDMLAKQKGYQGGYIDPKDVEGVSLGSAANTILNDAKKAASLIPPGL